MVSFHFTSSSSLSSTNLPSSISPRTITYLTSLLPPPQDSSSGWILLRAGRDLGNRPSSDFLPFGNTPSPPSTLPSSHLLAHLSSSSGLLRNTFTDSVVHPSTLSLGSGSGSRHDGRPSPSESHVRSSLLAHAQHQDQVSRPSALVSTICTSYYSADSSRSTPSPQTAPATGKNTYSASISKGLRTRIRSGLSRNVEVGMSLVSTRRSVLLLLLPSITLSTPLVFSSS